MLIRRPTDIKPSEITRPDDYFNRRRFMLGGLAGGAALLAGGAARAVTLPSTPGARLEGVARSPLSTNEAPNSFEDVTTYNNYYEFGTGKGDPARHAGSFKPRPWTVEVGGHVDKPGRYDLDDLLRPHALEERIYRLRCVEAWSMVVPWVGIPLADIVKRLQPTSNAKYVRFVTLHDAERMPGQASRVLPWPYQEALTIDEATNPLTLLAVGIYDRLLPNQNGAPIRLVVPWKYGFKSIKGIVRIEFVEDMPPTTWNQSAPHEYGFFANVNPNVDHPRWTQATERPIGAGLFAERQPTQMWNGYGEQVAHLYAGLDLQRHF